MFVHCPHPASDASGFASSALQSTRCGPPPVEHPWHVHDPSCPLSHSQREVVVLGTVEARAEPAEFVDKGRRNTDR